MPLVMGVHCLGAFRELELVRPENFHQVGLFVEILRNFINGLWVLSEVCDKTLVFFFLLRLERSVAFKYKPSVFHPGIRALREKSVSLSWWSEKIVT